MRFMGSWRIFPVLVKWGRGEFAGLLGTKSREDGVGTTFSKPPRPHEIPPSSFYLF